MCRAARTFQTLNYTASVFFLTAMSIDRYIAVAYTTRAQQVRYICFIKLFSLSKINCFVYLKQMQLRTGGCY